MNCCERKCIPTHPSQKWTKLHISYKYRSYIPALQHRRVCPLYRSRHLVSETPEKSRNLSVSGRWWCGGAVPAPVSRPAVTLLHHLTCIPPHNGDITMHMMHTMHQGPTPSPQTDAEECYSQSPSCDGCSRSND